MYNTNTVYLELMNESSTDCFILSLKQFIARRRQGKRLMSDNWSNVIGAERKLKESLNGIDHWVIITNFLSQHNINWRFNLPYSPWMGQISETCIESRYSKSFDCRQNVYYSYMWSLSIQEQRPLVCISNGVSDYKCLTHNHFLVGKSNKISQTGISD